MPTQEELDAHGLSLEDYEEEDFVFVWPSNRRAFDFFRGVGTRWYAGPAGPIGLRWEAIYPLMDRMGLAAEEWDALRADLEVMERAALAEIGRQK